MSPVEVGLPSTHRLHFNEMSNDMFRRCKLDFLDEKIDDSQVKLPTTRERWPAITMLR